MCGSGSTRLRCSPRKRPETWSPTAPIAELLRLQRREIAAGRGQHPGRLRLRLHGKHLPDRVRPFPSGLHPQLHLGRRGAGRAGKHRVRRAIGHSVRSSRASPDDVAGLGGMCAVGACGDSVDGHRQARFVRGRHRRHVRDRRDRLRTHRSVHSRAVRHPLPLQRIGIGGQHSPASSAARCHR